MTERGAPEVELHTVEIVFTSAAPACASTSSRFDGVVDMPTDGYRQDVHS
jgi:hypothetical protein